MQSEQSEILEALQFSIQMEIDGEKYYRQASKRCEIKVGRDLFEWLAGQEHFHREKFEQIYKDIRDHKNWPDIDMKPGRNIDVTTIFSEVKNPVVCKIETQNVLLKTIAGAMEIEHKTREFYRKQSESAVYEMQRKFYETLAAEEQKHYLALVDYREYLTDPVNWFTKLEHHSFDGG
jgi:rubrerythrin